MVMPKRPDPTLRETPELELAREFVRLSYPVTLPASYSPPDLPTPKGQNGCRSSSGTETVK
jgi:hypothetical protein